MLFNNCPTAFQPFGPFGKHVPARRPHARRDISSQGTHAGAAADHEPAPKEIVNDSAVIQRIARDCHTFG